MSYAEAQITEYISVFYFCAQPLSMTMMLVVISSMSQNMNEGRQVSLYVDGQGRYRFLQINSEREEMQDADLSNLLTTQHDQSSYNIEVMPENPSEQ